jgi:PAS domain S-box-containing protein
MTENAARLFTALAQAADGAFVIDENQTILFWNRAAQDILGFTADEIVGRKCWDILEGRDELSRLVCHYRCRIVLATLIGNGVANYDVRAHTKSGELRWINVSILPFPTANGAAPLIVHLFRDVTEKKHSEALIRQILDAAEQLRRHSAPFPAPSSRADQVRLTQREREILGLLAQGLSTRDIARSLSISQATARNHIQNILHKLRVNNRLQAVTYALEQGLISKS